MSVQIIVDSTADMPQELMKRVKVVPMSIRFGEREFVDGKTIDAEKFYAMLETAETLPTTSQPTPAAFEDAFRECVEAGDEVVCLTIASKLSGTYQSATIAAEEFPDKVFVLDCRTVTIASGVLTAYALNLADGGMGAREILETLIACRKQVRLLAIVDTLEYLKKGGRLSSAAALVGGLLNVKPIICVEDGEIKVIGTARGMKKAYAALTAEVEKTGGIDHARPVLLGYTGRSAQPLHKYMEENGHLWAEGTPCTVIGSTVGTHAGPGAVAAAFFSKE